MALTGRLGTVASRPGDLQPGNPGTAAPSGPQTYPITRSTTQSTSVALTTNIVPVRLTQAELVLLQTDLGAVRATQSELVLLQTDMGAVRATQAELVVLTQGLSDVQVTATQSTTATLTAGRLLRRTLSATQSQVVALRKQAQFVRRISQSQFLPLINRKIIHGRLLKRTATVTQAEVVNRASTFRTVSTTQAQSVRLLNRPNLIRTAQQAQSASV